ncbi:pre-toxin TG domain-containing protein [Achromobacter dolens]|nr:pre-toxin TG domain-containing protein [Achromobacter dolens]
MSYAERIQAAKEYADLEGKWGARGTYSQWGTIILGAASGNVMGGTGQFVQAATVNYLQTLGAAQIKELSRELGGEGSAGHAALHAVLGCAGAAAQGASCGAGGVGALSGVVLSKLLENLEGDGGKNLSAEDQQARVNLITSIAAGIAAAIDPNAASAAQVAARIELENNSRYMNRDKVGRLKAELTDELLRECTEARCFQEGFDRADRMASAYDVALILSHYPQLTKEKADTLAQAVLDLAPGVSNASALYELVTGRTATGEEANRFFSSLGLVPVVGGMLKKGGQALHVFADVGKAVDVGKVGGRAGAAVANGIEIAPGKFDYLFGRVSSNAHNAARSNQLALEMKRLGIPDTVAGRKMLSEHLAQSVKSEGNVSRIFSNQYGNFEVRESLFIGPSGNAAKFESTFQVLEDGTRRLSTIIPFN